MGKTSDSNSNPTKPSITNRALRRMGWLSFLVAAAISSYAVYATVAANETIVIAFLTHAAACFGMPTVRNIMEGYAPNLAKKS